jgi:hypothetical protein
VTAPATGPSWCARARSGHAACAELGEHTSRTYRANPSGDELLGVRVCMSLFIDQDGRVAAEPVVWIILTEDGEDNGYPLTRGQGRVVRHALSRLLDASRRGAK